MQKQLPNYSIASVLVIGDIMLDRYWFGDTARISPEAPVPVVNIKQTDDRPGGAGNVALNIAALGTKVTLLGISGNDAAAQTLAEQLSAALVSHDIIRLKNTPTITKLRVISRQQQLIRLDFEEKPAEYQPDELINIYKQHLAHTNLVILSDYNKGTLICAQQLIQLAREANIPVLVDPKGHDFSMYSGATVITPNLKEFETIVGACNSEDEIVRKGRHFLQQHDIQSLLLTRGERGMTLIQQHSDEVHLPAHARQVFDVTGAGDTVIAVLGASVAAGATLPEAMTLANLAASLVVAKLGAATVSAPELQIGLTHSTAFSTGVINEDLLLLAVSDAHLNGKRVVFTNGCFDILHAGHVKYLQQAKQLGDHLIVAINDDNSITRLKGPGRPINTVEQRLAVLAGLGVVDWVIPFADDTPERLLKKLKPDILVKGGDYSVEQVVGADIVYAYGGDVRVLSMVKDVSTTRIIERTIHNYKTTAAKQDEEKTQ
jgi:D-beta-D-heptose 7-phosphate kinase/D-beta-D-heptose 1-phosphate adenosyltransferase